MSAPAATAAPPPAPPARRGGRGRGAGLPRPRPEAILAAPVGEIDGLDDEPGLGRRAVASDWRRFKRHVATVAVVSAVAITVVTGLVLAALLAGIWSPATEPTRSRPHPFQLPGMVASEIMDIRGDPILVQRRETEVDRTIPFNMAVDLDVGAPVLDRAKLVADSLVSETGGFMARIPEGDIAKEHFEPPPLDQQNQGDLGAAFAASRPLDPGDARIVVSDWPAPDAGEVADGFTDLGAEAAVRTAAVASRWIRATPGPVAVDPNGVLEIATNVETLRVRRYADDAPAIQDRLVLLGAGESVGAALVRDRIAPATAQVLQDAFEAAFASGTPQPGARLEYRRLPAAPGEAGPRPVQVTLYAGETYVGTISLADSGAYEPGVEPWSPGSDQRDTGPPPPPPGYTLRDGIYSTAIRNGVPTPVLRQTMRLVARLADLGQPAMPGDRLKILTAAGGSDPDRLIYVGLRHGGASTECYVFRADAKSDYSCIDPNGTVGPEGMVAPISGGVITSKFGWRMHPILKRPKLHKGMDWAAPKGTPVVAVNDGTVNFAGVAGGYGNFVSVGHGEGIDSHYAHLDSIEPGIANGVPVKKGQRIGYLGTTGLSTGPHLHFEIFVKGEPTDPLNFSFTATKSQLPDAVLAAFLDRKAQLAAILGP